jgi:hypothetical protein
MKILEYILGQVSEEAAELVQAASKANRFGLEDRYENKSNRERLLEEMHDLRTACDVVLEHIGERTEFEVSHCQKDLLKRLKMSKWMEYAKRHGTLDL